MDTDDAPLMSKDMLEAAEEFYGNQFKPGLRG
jgi:hypothetical protein